MDVRKASDNERIFTIVAGVIGIILGLYLIRPSKRGEILDLWKTKWSCSVVKSKGRTFALPSGESETTTHS